VYLVPSMTVPAPGAHAAVVLASEAVRLLAGRAAARQQDQRALRDWRGKRLRRPDRQHRQHRQLAGSLHGRGRVMPCSRATRARSRRAWRTCGGKADA
jgi:hypothetical protein